MSEENRHDIPDSSRACEGPLADADERGALPMITPQARPEVPPKAPSLTSPEVPSEAEGSEAEGSLSKEEVLPKALNEAEGALPKDEILTKAPSQTSSQISSQISSQTSSESERSESERSESERSKAKGSESDRGESEGSPLAPPVPSEAEGSDVERPKDEVPREAIPEGEKDERVEGESPWSKDCRVKLEIFEGPLDLLLFLIRREEIDIYDIPITEITDQYMEYLDIMRMLDLDIASDFLVMAATLIHIKSRMLLPPEERVEEEEEEYDPRMDLVRQLLEYKKFKDAASTLHTMEIEQEKLFPRAGINEPPKADPTSLDASIFDLLTAFGEVLKRSDAAHLREIVADRFTVADRIMYITNTLREVASITFDSLFKDVASRSEIVVTFLALLELVRTKKILVQQDKSFGTIRIIAQAA